MVITIRKLLIFCLIALGSNAAYPLQTAQTTIERYQSERDKECLKTILHDFTEELLGDIHPEDALTSLERNPNTHVLRTDNTTVGFINYLIRDGRFFNFEQGPTGYINGIGVLKEYQKNGYGKLLLHFALDRLQKLQAPVVILVVRTKNTKVIPFYEKQGFMFSHLSNNGGYVFKQSLTTIKPEPISNPEQPISSPPKPNSIKPISNPRKQRISGPRKGVISPRKRVSNPRKRLSTGKRLSSPRKGISSPRKPMAGTRKQIKR